MVRVLLLIVVGAAMTGCYVRAPFDGLARGEAAPPLGVDAWINADEPVVLDDIEGPVLLEFWSYDCGPCRRSVDTIKALQTAYPEITIVSVHMNLGKGAQDEAAIREYVRSRGITYPVGVNEDDELWRRYGFNYLPHGVLLDASGVLWSGNMVAWSLERAVQREFGGPEAPFETLAIDHGAHEDCEDGVCRRAP